MLQLLLDHGIGEVPHNAQELMSAEPAASWHQPSGGDQLTSLKQASLLHCFVNHGRGRLLE